MSANEYFEMVSRLITNLEKKPLLEDSFDPRSLVLTKRSSKEEVAAWLEEEGFLIALDKLKGITGKELYSTSKDDFRKMLGFAESARLFSRLLKEKEHLPAAEQTIKESDFERFMRIRREDVDSRIPNNPITSFDGPNVPAKPSRPMIRDVFVEQPEPVKYVEKVKKSKEKSPEKKSARKSESKQREEPVKKEKRSKERRERESHESSGSTSGDDSKMRRRSKHSKEKKTRDKEEGKGKKEKHKKSRKSKRSQEKYSDLESDSASESEEKTPPKRSRHRNKRKEKEREKPQEKDLKKEAQTEPVSPPPTQPHQLHDPLRPQLSPYGAVPQMLAHPLPPQYPAPFPDPYTSQLMVQQAQIARAEQDRFAAEMRLRQLKSGFSAPGAISFPPHMQHFQSFNF